jgi:transposase-like protein
MDTSVALSQGRRRRRIHSSEFKAHIVAACCQPGVSSAAVAVANGINANLVRRWVKEAEVGTEKDNAASEPEATMPATALTRTFLPVSLPTPAPAPVAADIRIELQRGATSVTVTWPASAASECAAWMRELLR